MNVQKYTGHSTTNRTEKAYPFNPTVGAYLAAAKEPKENPADMSSLAQRLAHGNVTA